MQYCRTPNGDNNAPNINAQYEMIERGTFDGVAASFDARTHHRHNGWIAWMPGEQPPAPYDHVRGLATIDYITPRPVGGQAYFDTMMTVRIVYTDKVLSMMQDLLNRFSPGTPPVNLPLSPHSQLRKTATADTPIPSVRLKRASKQAPPA